MIKFQNIQKYRLTKNTFTNDDSIIFLNILINSKTFCCPSDSFLCILIINSASFRKELYQFEKGEMIL